MPSSATFDDAWRERALRGDAAAVQQLADHAITPLFRFCYYRVGKDRDLCEEVVQETLLRAIRDLERYEPARADGEVMPWLQGLARNEVRRALAQRPNATSLELFWEKLDREFLAVHARLETEPLVDEQLEREETSELVNATMSQLAAPHREALEAKYVRGQTVRALAQLWRTTEKAVESRLSRARKAFRETFLALVRSLEAEAEGAAT